jgi:hypothetical protein
MTGATAATSLNSIGTSEDQLAAKLLVRRAVPNGAGPPNKTA